MQANPILPRLSYVDMQLSLARHDNRFFHSIELLHTGRTSFGRFLIRLTIQGLERVVKPYFAKNQTLGAPSMIA